MGCSFTKIFTDDDGEKGEQGKMGVGKAGGEGGATAGKTANGEKDLFPGGKAFSVYEDAKFEDDDDEDLNSAAAADQAGKDAGKATMMGDDNQPVFGEQAKQAKQGRGGKAESSSWFKGIPAPTMRKKQQPRKVMSKMNSKSKNKLTPAKVAKLVVAVKNKKQSKSKGAAPKKTKSKDKTVSLARKLSSKSRKTKKSSSKMKKSKKSSSKK